MHQGFRLRFRLLRFHDRQMRRCSHWCAKPFCHLFIIKIDIFFFRNLAQTRDGGCGFGEAVPNNRAAIAIQGPNATRAPGVPAPGQAAPAAAPAAGGGGGGSVTVKAGDTCAAIAASRGTTAGAIIAANPQINAGCTNLQVGQTLNVGGGGGGGEPFSLFSFS